jgi:predicted  nucleic acid-binding Zn-ribbon protein
MKDSGQSLSGRMWSGVRGLFRYLGLRPYGDSLLEPGARFWLATMRLLIAIMATTEATVWAQVVALAARSYQYRLEVAAAVATVVFLLVWVVDTSLATLDVSGAKERGGASGYFKIGASLALRLGMAVLSLWVVKPALTRVVFSNELRIRIAEENVAAIERRRQALADEAKASVDELESRVLGLQERLVEEISGTGLSRTAGDGRVARQIRLNLETAARELDAARQTELSRLAAFDAVRGNPSELRSRYGLVPLEYGLDTPLELLARGSDQASQEATRQAVRATERQISSFLAMIFIALLLLKLFQPTPVDIYFNAELQDAYGEYLRGAFNSVLSAEQRPNSSSWMRAISFRDWHKGYKRDVVEVRERELAARRTAKAFKDGVSQLAEIRDDVKVEEAAQRSELSDLSRSRGQLRNALKLIEARSSRLSAHEKELRAQLASLVGDVADLAKHEHGLIHFTQAERSMRDELCSALDELNEATAEEQRHRDELLAIDERVVEVREQLGESIDSDRSFRRRLQYRREEYAERVSAMSDPASAADAPRLAKVLRLEQPVSGTAT